MQTWMIKPLLFQTDGLQRWKARGLQWLENQFYVIERYGNGMYVATVKGSNYRGYLGQGLEFSQAVEMCVAHHEQQLSEWLAPVYQDVPVAASPPEKNQE